MSRLKNILLLSLLLALGGVHGLDAQQGNRF